MKEFTIQNLKVLVDIIKKGKGQMQGEKQKSIFFFQFRCNKGPITVIHRKLLWFNRNIAKIKKWQEMNKHFTENK